MLQQLIEKVTTGVPAALREVRSLGRTLAKRAADVLPTSTGPVHPTEPPRPSTADSNTCAAPHSGSAT
jgi:hypothetical protein